MNAAGLVIGVVAGAVLIGSSLRADELEPTPVPGLTDSQSWRWQLGRDEFERDTLGEVWAAHDQIAITPVFQRALSCATCHRGSGVGGSGFAHQSQIWLHTGWRGFLDEAGNPVPIVRMLNRLTRIQDPAQDQFGVEMPEGVIGKSIRKPRRVMGLGYVEAIDDAAILAEEAKQRLEGRVSGVATRSSQTGRVTRFGSQNLFATLETFARYADRQELSLDYEDIQYAESDACWSGAGRDALFHCLAPGRQQRLRDFLLLTDFRIDVADHKDWDARMRAAGARGGEVFAEIGCTDCHRPRWPVNGPGSARDVVLYSDLLCHDLGEINSDGISTGFCGASEWRTAILTNNGWDGALGYMHDRKASLVSETRFYHQGEAAPHASRWARLSDQDAHALHTFLLSPRTFVDRVEASLP